MTEDIEVSRHSAVRFPGISPRAYEHPVDRGALATLRAVPGFAQVVKAHLERFGQRDELDVVWAGPEAAGATGR